MESKDVLEWLRLNATPLLPTIRRRWPRERVPAEGDKGWQAALRSLWSYLSDSLVCPRGRFNQTLAKLIADPAGLCASPANCPQLTLDQQVRIYLTFDGIRGVTFIIEANITPKWLKDLFDQVTGIFFVTTSIDWKQSGLFNPCAVLTSFIHWLF